MAFLKSSQITGLSARDVDVKGFTQADSINLDGSYTEHEVLLADAYNIKGNVTVSENLILSKLSDDGDDITITGDTTTRTITGSGSIEGATLAQTPNATLTGMTGNPILGSTTTFPTGSVINVVSTIKTDTFTHNNSNVTTITGLTVNITPKSTSNKILIMGSICYGHDTSNSGYPLKLFRGSTEIGSGSAAGSRPYGIADLNMPGWGTYYLAHTHVSFLDSPNTIDPLTYSFKVVSRDGSVLYINRTTF